MIEVIDPRSYAGYQLLLRGEGKGSGGKWKLMGVKEFAVAVAVTRLLDCLFAGGNMTFHHDSRHLDKRQPQWE